jgi:predicted porin
MKRLGLVLLATVGLAYLAQAADLPTTKAPAAAAPAPDCWASFWDWLHSSSYDCPISAYGITLYGSLDVGLSDLAPGVGYNPSMDKLNYGIQKNAYANRWTASYNALSTSVLGLSMKESLAPLGLPGWSLVGVLEAGIVPFSGMFDNGPRALADNNLRPAGKWPWQASNFDGSRAGQWDNSQGYLGLNHPVFGTLTFGRTNALSYDVTSGYDPAASIAFSALGFSNAFPGFGDTETARPNTAFTYRLTYQNFRAAAQAQIGGYDWGNATQGMYQGQLGADFGPLSLDGVISWAKDAVSLSSFGGSNNFCVKGTTDCFVFVNNAYYDPNSVLKATLSNNTGLELVAKYKWNSVTFYGGYLYALLQNPSDSDLTGFPTIAEGIFVPAGYFSKGVYTNAAVTDSAYNDHRMLNTVWTGFKWYVWDNLSVAMGFYYQTQNNYNFSVNASGMTVPAACTGTGAFTSSSKCAGSQDAVSLLVDYRPVGRVDLYAGVMLSNVYGGLANGFTQTTAYYAPEAHGKILTATATTANTQEWDPTVGIRIRF